MTQDATRGPKGDAATGRPPAEAAMASHFSRRRLLGVGLVAAGVPVLAGRRIGGGPASPTATAGQDSMPATELEIVNVQGSPVAPAVESPAARQRVATPPPVTEGLEVIRDQRPTYDEEPVTGGELRLFLGPGDNSDFSPVAFRQDFQVVASYLDPLVWVDEVTMEPRPWLAERWEWNDDRTQITYTLRPDVVWHDGEPLTARDVRFSLFVYRDDINSGVRNLFSTMDNAETVGAHQLRVTLSAPDGGWLLNASNQGVFQRQQYIDHWESRPVGERTLSGFNWQREAPVGTGPWKVGRRGESFVEFSRHETYWAGAPHFETMTLAAEDDPAVRLDAWRRGDVDLLWPVRPRDVPEIEDEPGRLHVADTASVMFAAFNFDNPARAVPDLFADVGVRRALALAIDRDRYATEVFGGFIQQDKGGTVAQPWAYDSQVVNPIRDVEAAQDLLRQAGWEDRNGDGIVEHVSGQPLHLTTIVRNDSRAALLALLDLIVTDMAEVGVWFDVQRLAPDRFRERWIVTRDFDLIAYAYNLFAGFTDFDLYGSGWDIRINRQGWNPGAYRNEAVDEAILEILVEPDLDAQRDALSRLQRAADEDLFGLWFGFPQDLILVRPDILGFQPNKMWQTWDTRKLWRRPDRGLRTED